MKAVFSRFLDVLRDGISLFWLAPLIVALVVIPEMIQHIAEINLGMFESKAEFQKLADDPRRMVWGIIKIVGLLLCIIAAARFWGARERGQNWWDVRHLAWRNFAIALALLLVTSIPSFVLPEMVGQEFTDIVGLVILVATLPLIPLLIAGLIGDKSATLKSIYRTGWLQALRMMIFAAALWIPLQWLHGKNHSWALGQSDAVVWALMIFDSLLVGALAAYAGTAFHHGYQLNANKGQIPNDD